ncbi:MAG: hypothetical protein Q8O06_05805, partial [Acetobacterium sp.]|nr:hypothetical protein [Acetobacterium sp.]
CHLNFIRNWGSFLFFYSHPMGEFEKSLKAMVSGVLMGVYYVFVNNTGLVDVSNFSVRVDLIFLISKSFCSYSKFIFLFS